VPLGHSSVVHLILFISSDSPVCNEQVVPSPEPSPEPSPAPSPEPLPDLVEPDLALHQSLPDLLRHLLRNLVEPDLALHQRLPDSLEASEPSPELTRCLHQFTPELFWVEHLISLKYWGKNTCKTCWQTGFFRIYDQLLIMFDFKRFECASPQHFSQKVPNLWPQMPAFLCFL